MHNIYRSGECVRDELMGLETKITEYLFVLDNLNLEITEGFKLMKNWMNYQGFQILEIFSETFTITAKFPPSKEENSLTNFILAKKESYFPEVNRSILKLGTLEDELSRKDFTINSLALSEEGELIDLFGGEMDIKRKLIKTPSDPQITLLEDPLRILKAMSFAIKEEFFIDEDIWKAMKNPQILSKLKKHVKREEIQTEVSKMMQANTASAIRLLSEVDEHNMPGILEVIFSKGFWLKPTFE